MRRRLPRVERQQDEVRHQQRVGRQQAVEQCGSSAASTVDAEDDTRIDVDLAPDEAAVDLARRRRPGRARRARSFGAFGIVTKTMSGRVRSSTASRLVVAPTTRTPFSRRPRSRGSSSTNATTRSPGVSRSSRSMLRPVRPGADDQDAPSFAAARQLDAADDRALREARARRSRSCRSGRRSRRRCGRSRRARPASARRCRARRPPRRRRRTPRAARRASSRSARRPAYMPVSSSAA